MNIPSLNPGNENVLTAGPTGRWINRLTGPLQRWISGVQGQLQALNLQSAGNGVVFIGNCTAEPAANPVGGGLLYVLNGALKYRSPAGTVTVIAPD